MAEVLIAEIRSEGSPQRGQKERSSANFSLADLPEGTRELLWRTEPDAGTIRFHVMSDVWANPDHPVLSNIAPGARTAVPRERESLARRGFYIANPSGAPDTGFIVRVYALAP